MGAEAGKHKPPTQARHYNRAIPFPACVNIFSAKPIQHPEKLPNQNF